MLVKRYFVDICDQCIQLEGEQCNNPHCVFCRRSMSEVGEILDQTLIRPVVDGQRIEVLQVGAPQVELYVFDLVAHLERQRAFSQQTFGPGQRTQGVLDHIRKELVEIEASPSDLSEWIDVVLLALDGACRAGFSSQEIASALGAKQTRNEARTWPDWRTADPNKAIQHTKASE